MHYAGARYYMSALGRWTSMEPLLKGNPKRLLEKGMGPLLRTSGYNYSLNNPANLTDPDGRCPICIPWAVFEVGSAEYDAYQAYQVHNDPNATAAEKREATRLATLGAVGPEGGYTALPNLGKHLDNIGRWLDEAGEASYKWYRRAFLKGKSGEVRVAGAMGFKKNQSQVTLESARFETDSGTRVIDFMSPERGMVEVKNRKSLDFERQLRDFAEYAAEEGIEFTIVVRERTEIGGEPLYRTKVNGLDVQRYGS